MGGDQHGGVSATGPPPPSIKEGENASSVICELAAGSGMGGNFVSLYPHPTLPRQGGGNTANTRHVILRTPSVREDLLSLRIIPFGNRLLSTLALRRLRTAGGG